MMTNLAADVKQLGKHTDNLATRSTSSESPDRKPPEQGQNDEITNTGDQGNAMRIE
jgi:hypothetical protein